MNTYKLPYLIYKIFRSASHRLGLFRQARRIFGPTIGRYLYRRIQKGDDPILVNGSKMFLAQPKTYPPVDMVLGKFEPQTTALFARLVKPGMNIIDIGAHVGYYALMAARLSTSMGKIFAFEPNPGNYDLLCKNIKLNHLDNILPINQVVSDICGTQTLYLTNLDNGRHSIYQHGLPQNGNIRVEGTTVDSFLSKHCLLGVDIIKIDVEGAESDVLDGMKGLLKSSTPLKMIIEFNPSLLSSAGVNPKEFLDIVASWGFEINYIDETSGIKILNVNDQLDLVNRMSTEESSVNILCSR